MKKTEPTHRLVPATGKPAHRYIPAVATDIRKTFAAALANAYVRAVRQGQVS